MHPAPPELTDVQYTRTLSRYQRQLCRESEALRTHLQATWDASRLVYEQGRRLQANWWCVR